MNICVCGANYDNTYNFCEKCGVVVGRSPKMKFVEVLREYLGDTNHINLSNITVYKGTIAWNYAKEKVPAFADLNDDEIVERLRSNHD